MGSCLSQQQQPTSTATPASPTPASSSGRSPIYNEMPKGAQKFAVRNVYDGDTLTLVDDQRVRLLGVDAPEMKPSPQPFAEEAKEYTKSRCHKQDIWLVINGKDHYGRLLAHIFVQQNNGYLSIAEGLVQQGLAYAYIPNKDEKPFNWEKLVVFQHDARNAKRGLWKSFRDVGVVKTANGSAYHQRSCEHMSNIRNLQELKVSAAVDLGLHPCRTCMA